MFRFEELEIWKLSFEYADTIYDLTKSFPANEQFGLVDQLRRASLSISTNIAEGSSGSPKEFIRYIAIAIRSALETVSLLKFAQQRGFISEAVTGGLYEDAERLIRKARCFQKALQEPVSALR